MASEEMRAVTELLQQDPTFKGRAAGVAADLEIFEEAFHVFQNMPQLPESTAALTAAGAFFDRGIQ